MARRSKKGPKTLWDKVKEVDETFAQEVYSATDDNLKSRLSTICIQMTLNENEMEKDQDLKSLREQAKQAAKTYTEPLAALKLKRKLVYKILEERGKAP
jgi:hypothetical protein